MISIETLRMESLALPETTEEPHFEKTSFRVKGKIFATYDSMNHMACIKLSELDQNVFTKISRGSIFPVPNKWGKSGWTNIDLNTVDKDIFCDALITAYCTVAPKKLALQVRPDTPESL